MANNTTGTAIRLGDPVPGFSGSTLTDGAFDLQVNAGRWIVLCFLGSPRNPRMPEELCAVLADAHRFSEDRLVFCGILSEPPEDAALLKTLSNNAVSFLVDHDGAIARTFGAHEMPRTIILDAMLRAVTNIPWDYAEGHARTVRNVLASLPDVDDAAGVPLFAPALIVPRVLDFSLCDYLIRLYEKVGGEDSGFLLDVDGRTATIVDHKRKRRSDLIVALPEAREAIRDQFVRRLLPAMEAYLQFRATRMDRYLVACYDSEVGGHFVRHRDNVNAGAQHRRFAVSINLNKDFDGCDVVFPEFGRRTYRSPVGGALVFSCGALHQVTPITRGRRYAFLAFLYDEADAAKRQANNARLCDGEARYSGLRDRLFPDIAA